MHISPEFGDLPEVDDTPPSRPLTPHEQMDIMREIEKEDDEQTGLPSDRDLEVNVILSHCFGHIFW